MWRRVAVDALERLHRLVEARRRCSSGRPAGSRRSAPCRSPMPPSGWVWTTQWAASLNADDAELVARRSARPRPAGSPPCRCRPCGRRRCRVPPPIAAVERVAVAGVHRARLVDDDDERDVGLLLPVADAHVDRQRLLERRLLVAAGAVALRARRPSPGPCRGRGRRPGAPPAAGRDSRSRGTSTRTTLS